MEHKVLAGSVALALSLSLTACSTGASDADEAGDSSVSSSASNAKPSSDWYSEAWGTFDAFTVSGTGGQVIELPKSSEGGWVTLKSTGAKSVHLSGLDDDNQSTNDDLPGVDRFDEGTEDYAGAGVFGANADYIPTKIQVEASDPWTITIHPASDAPKLPASGEGSGVFKYDGAAATPNVSFTGSGNFIVDQTSHEESRNVIANSIDDYTGQLALMKGPSLVHVSAEGGTWTIG